MKASLAIIACLSLLAFTVGASPSIAQASDVSLEVSIRSFSARCCVAGCSQNELASLRELLEENRHSYEPSVREVVEFAQQVLDGSADCSGISAIVPIEGEHHRATRVTNSLSLTCPSTAIDVSFRPVDVTCQFTAVLNVNVGCVYFSSGLSGQMFSVNGSVCATTPSTRYSGSFTFTVSSNMPNGTWIVRASVTDSNYQLTVNSASTPKFVVKPHLSDMANPSLNGIAISAAFTVDPCGASNYVTVTISDNLSGVVSCKISYIPTSNNYPQPADSIINFATPIVSAQQFKVIPKFSVPSYASGSAVLVYVTLTDAANNVATFAGYQVSVYSSQCGASFYIPAVLYQNGTSVTGSDCRRCPAYTFSDYGWAGCCACSTGSSYDPTKFGYQACPLCPAGYSGNGGSTNCTICPAGTFASDIGNAVCTPCPYGTGSSAGSTSCLICPSGSAAVAGVCTQCAKGTYSTNGLPCVSCSSGSFASNLGQNKCDLCPLNTYAPSSKAATCTACPSGTGSSAGSNSILNCK